MRYCTTYIDFMGEDFILTAHFKCTTRGTANWRWSGINPDEWAPEFDVNAIFLERDALDGLGPAFEATGELFRVLEDRDDLFDAMFDAMCEEMTE